MNNPRQPKGWAQFALARFINVDPYALRTPDHDPGSEWRAPQQTTHVRPEQSVDPRASYPASRWR